MKGEVRKRVEREVGSVNRMMSIVHFWRIKEDYASGGGGGCFISTAHSSGRMFHENWTLGKRLRGGGRKICFMRSAGKIGGGWSL